MDGVRWRDRHHWRERRHGRRGPRFVEFDRGATGGDEKTGKRGCSRQVERLERPVREIKQCGSQQRGYRAGRDM